MKPKFIFCLALIVSSGLSGCITTKNSVENRHWGTVVDGLQMALSVSGPDNRKDVGFEVTFRNAGEQDVCLNLGQMLANGKVQLPTKIYLKLKNESGMVRNLRFPMRGVIGRVDDYVVPLRAGSTYTVHLGLDQFWSPDTKEFELKLKSGRYEVSAEFQGTGAETVNLDMEGMKLMNFWKGQRQTGVVTFIE